MLLTEYLLTKAKPVFSRLAAIEEKKQWNISFWFSGCYTAEDSNLIR